MSEMGILVARFEQFDKGMADRFADVNHRLDDITGRLTGLDGRMTSIDTRLDGKATQGQVQFWGVFVTSWISIAVAIIKPWP